MSKLTSLTVTLILTSVLTSLLFTSGEASKKHKCRGKGSCKNGGVCKLYADDVSKCDCPGTGRTKEHCIDVCKVLTVGVFKCDCAGTGYTGDKCTEKISPMVSTKPPCISQCRNIVSPCYSAKCPRFPNAECRSNCDCNAEFWLDGVDVTSDCHAGVLPVPDLCALPAVDGPCKSSAPRHYYDTKKHECMRFLYGLCDGNDNNFITMDGCRNTCEKGICSLPPDGGNCRASITKYHYNMKTGKCEEFDYGGCGGNENRFESEQECREACYPWYVLPDPWDW